MPNTAQGFDDSDDEDEVSDCPECGAEVYRIADCCPKCGYWFVDEDDDLIPGSRRTHAGSRIVKLASVILVAALIVALLIAGAATMGS